MTARDYHGTPDFDAFLALWVEARRPVPEFGDWLRDRGLDGPADAVAWAASRPDRPVYHPIGDERGGKCGPYPTTVSTLRPDLWFWSAHRDGVFLYDNSAHEVPRELLRDDARLRHDFRTITEAIVWLLDAFSPGHPG